MQAFAAVKDAALQRRLAASTKRPPTRSPTTPCGSKKELLPRAKGHFAIGADAFAQKLAADEGITEPLDPLLARGEAELARLRAGVHRHRARRSIPRARRPRCRRRSPPITASPRR